MDQRTGDEVEVAPRFLPKSENVQPTAAVATGTTANAAAVASGGVVAFISAHKIIIICVVILALVILVIYFVYASPQKQNISPMVQNTPPNQSVQQNNAKYLEQQNTQQQNSQQQTQNTQQQNTPQQNTQQQAQKRDNSCQPTQLSREERSTLLQEIEQSRRAKEQAQNTENNPNIIVDLDESPEMLAAEQIHLSQLQDEQPDRPVIVDIPNSAAGRFTNDQDPFIIDQSVSLTHELHQCAQILANGAQCRKKTREEYCPTHAK